MASPRRKVWVRSGLLVGLVVACLAIAADWFLDIHPFFGSRVAFIGDVDGDGVADFVVGETGWGSGRRVTAVSGRRGMVLYHVTGGASGTGFGEAIAGVGDLDGDGVPDFAVGAPLAHRGEWTSGACPYAGEVWLVSGRRGKVLRILDGRELGVPGSSGDGRAGSSIAPAGDVDKDGLADVVVGLPETGGGRGLVAIVSGRDGRVLRRLEPTGDDREFGESLAGGVDFDGDGFPDQVVGIPGGNRRSYSGDGRVRLFSGKDGHVLWTCEGEGAGPNTKPAMGKRLSLLPDFDGDRVPEVLSAGGYEGGRIQAISGVSGKVLREWKPPDHGAPLQNPLAWIPDLDGDGVPEIVISRPVHEGIRIRVSQGEFFIPDSESTSLSEAVAISSRAGKRLWRFQGTAEAKVCTLTVVAGGDLDGDGFADVVVGELGLHGNRAGSGKVSALSGKDGHLLYVVSGGRR